VADWSSPSYAACGAACLGTNPRGPCQGAAKCPGHREKIVRGGSWYWKGHMATGYYRRFHVPSNRPFHHFGFRCAASLAEARKLAAAPAPTAAP
jgi:formylglycine-generating enzyme required for sulfatase activity